MDLKTKTQAPAGWTSHPSILQLLDLTERQKNVKQKYKARAAENLVCLILYFLWKGV